jgi:hypothetical protein
VKWFARGYSLVTDKPIKKGLKAQFVKTVQEVLELCF